MANYYMATTGDDADPGTLAEPWATFTKANATLVAGDTLYIRAGTYWSSYIPENGNICPANSGTAGNYITYTKYQEEVVTISQMNFAIDLCGKSYIKVDGLRFVGISERWLNMEGPTAGTSEHNIIQNNYFGELTGRPWAGLWFGYTEDNTAQCNYNQILNNEFHADYQCDPVEGGMGCDNIIQFVKNSSHNLIEGNSFYGGIHEAIGFYAGDTIIGDIKYNIIRNNYIENRWHTGLNIYCQSERNLIENNVIVHCGHDHLQNYCGTDRDRLNPDWIAGAVQVGGPRNIIRRNTISDSGAISINHYAIEQPWAANSNQTYIYHNSFTLNHKGIYGTTAETLEDCQIKNNIFYNELTAEESTPYEIQWDMQASSTDNYFINNNILGSGLVFWPSGEATLAYLQATYPTYWHDNTANNPLFVDAPNHNLYLQSNSPCINAGTWLTTITSSSGTGGSFVVANAGYFCDGWGIRTGDAIQVQGRTATATITNVNYTTNTITFTPNLTWLQGEGLALAYQGSAPDQGAFEYTEENEKTVNVSEKMTIKELLSYWSDRVSISGADKVSIVELGGAYMPPYAVHMIREGLRIRVV